MTRPPEHFWDFMEDGDFAKFAEKEMSEPKVVLKRTHATDQTEYTLRQAVLAYLSEHDNPVPDYSYRRTLRNYLRKMVGAPAEPPPRS